MKRIVFLFSLTIGGVSGVSALGQVGGGFDLTWNSVDGGGEMFSTGGGFELSGTVGQPDAGFMTGGGFELTGGFCCVTLNCTCLGDMTGDGLVNLDDVPAFILAMVDRPAYDLAFPLVNEESAGDIDGSGIFDTGDLGLFSGLFGGPATAGAQAVPEPSTLSLVVVLLMGIAIRPRRRV